MPTTGAPQLAPPGGGQALQRGERVVGDEHRAGASAHVRRGVLGRDEHAPGPGRERLRGEAPAVDALARAARRTGRPAPPRASRSPRARARRAARRARPAAPPAASATCSGDQRAHAAPRARRRRRRTAPSRPSGELLALLVALAGDDDDVARRGQRRSRARSPRGGRSSRSAPGPRPAAISAMIASGSSERGLSEVTIATSARSRGRRAHQRALAAVAVAAGAEDDDQPPGRQLARGAQHVLQRVGRVRVVDEDGEGLALVDRLEAARDALGARQRRGDRRVGRRRARGRRRPRRAR